MNTSMTNVPRWLAGLSVVLLVPESASLAQDDVDWVTTSRGRYEIAIGAHTWRTSCHLPSVTAPVSLSRLKLARKCRTVPASFATTWPEKIPRSQSCAGSPSA